MIEDNVWTKSTHCDAGSCVEVLVDDNLVFIRSSENGSLGPAAQFFTVEEWRAFLAGVRDGEFDV